MGRSYIRTPILLWLLSSAMLCPSFSTAAENEINNARLTVGGNTISSLKKVAYRVFKRKSTIRSNVLNEMRGPRESGWIIRGTITVRSESELMNALQIDEAKVDIHLETGHDKPGFQKRITFKNCVISHREFEIGSRGNAWTTYTFYANRFDEN